MISVDISKCTGCKRCEVACAFFHTGRINNHLARIKVMNLYDTGVDGPVVCSQCKERYCHCCPENAITIGPLGQVIVSPTLCTLCGTCEIVCPIGALEIFNDFVYVCDLCGGRPRCVDACTETAIVYETERAKRPFLADLREATKKMNPSQKRHFYLRTQDVEVRRNRRNTDA